MTDKTIAKTAFCGAALVACFLYYGEFYHLLGALIGISLGCVIALWAFGRS